MKTFKEYLNENSGLITTSLDEDPEKFLNTYCKAFAKSDVPLLYRGSSHLYEVGKENLKRNRLTFLDATSSYRESKSGTNYNTMILDYLFKTKFPQFPLRSKSLIATTDISYCKTFGPRNLIIPFDDDKLGCVNDGDIWFVRLNFTESVTFLNFFRALTAASSDYRLPTDNIDEFFAALDKGIKEDKFTNPYIPIVIPTKAKIIAAFTEVIENKFRACKPASFDNPGEVWFGPKAVAVPFNNSFDYAYIERKNGKWVINQ